MERGWTVGTEGDGGEEEGVAGMHFPLVLLLLGACRLEICSIPPLENFGCGRSHKQATTPKLGPLHMPASLRTWEVIYNQDKQRGCLNHMDSISFSGCTCWS